ncbi:MAG: LysR family transcriptional regulator [Gammaproteobacteria bacterium]|nr:LysR family transcriptional regulator [Gammaproteobacteria bacterium]
MSVSPCPKLPRVTLEQWGVLQAVVDHGGFAQAAEALSRSQSSVSYMIARLQEQVGVPVLAIQGRKAQLTPAGEVLLRRSRQLLGDALKLEELAQRLEQGWEPEVRLVVDEAFPNAKLMEALRRFAPVSRGTRVQLQEVIMSGADEALIEGRADVAVAPHVPPGFLGNKLCSVEFLCVAHCQHPLVEAGRELSLDDLRRELQVVIRDSGVRFKRDSGWLGAEQRWTVTSISTAISTVASGMGFAWLPVPEIEEHLQRGILKPLPLAQGAHKHANLFLILASPDLAGPAARALAEIIEKVAVGV